MTQNLPIPDENLSRRTGVTRPRLVILGASNITLALPQIVRAARTHFDQPADIFIAAGHGRSFIIPTRIMGRGLSSTLNCQLWPTLDRFNDPTQSEPAQPFTALITDIGNDIPYGQSPEAIIEAVRTAADRLHKLGAKTLITGLPLVSLRKLSPRRFKLFRSLLFPKSNLTLGDAIERSETISAALAGICESLGTAPQQHKPEWYGLDPIHIRRPYRYHAYLDWIATSPINSPAQQHPDHATQLSILERIRLRLAPPAERTLFGYPQTRTQPALILKDSTAVHLY